MPDFDSFPWSSRLARPLCLYAALPSHPFAPTAFSAILQIFQMLLVDLHALPRQKINMLSWPNSDPSTDLAMEESSPDDQELSQVERMNDDELTASAFGRRFGLVPTEEIGVAPPAAVTQAHPTDSSNQTHSRDTMARDAATLALPHNIHPSHEFPPNAAVVDQLQGVAGSDQTSFAQIDHSNPSLKLRGTNEHPSIQSIQRIGPSRRVYEQAQENRERVLLCIVIGLRDYSGRLVEGTNFMEEPYATYFELCRRRQMQRIRSIKPTKELLDKEVTRRFDLLDRERTRAPFRFPSDAVEWLQMQPIIDPSDVAFFTREISNFHRRVLNETRTNRTNDTKRQADLCSLEASLVAIRVSRQWCSENLLRPQCRAVAEIPSHRQQETDLLEANIFHVSLVVAEYKQTEMRLQTELQALQQDPVSLD